MDEAWIRQLDRRMDEHLSYLRERLDDLQGAVLALHRAVDERWAAHEAYHRANEHRWGLLRLAQRYPFRLAAAVGAAAWALATAHPGAAARFGQVLALLRRALE